MPPSWKNGDGRSYSDILAKGILNSFVLALSATLTLLFLIGSYDYFRNVEDNKCEMTYMFEYPEFIRIKLDSEMDKKYPQYGLYAYAEGKHVGPAKRHKFSGIPVLFVPGNAGSHKQVRSFASVALRKWLESKTPYHFDFFSLDFNEELSGLYGYVLSTQSAYLSAAIERIQGLYEDYHSVILIGHSMGGIVAKTLKDHSEPLTNLIISLSAPHSRPILVFDPEQDLFYYHLSRNWTNGNEKLSREVTLVSIAGGDRDHLVPEGFTKWGRHLDVHTTTTAVPGVWASTDHLCIVWCKQLVLSVVRALFDLVEYRQNNGFYAPTEDPVLRQKILEYHFVKKSSGKSFHGAHRDLEFGKPPGTGWNEILGHSICSSPSRSTTYIMFPLHIIKEKIRGDADDYKITLLTTNTGPKNWIFGCTAQSMADGTRYCSQGENLSKYGKLIPHFRRRRKVIHLRYTDISQYSHLIVRMDPLNLKSCVDLEVYEEKERSKDLIAKFHTQHKIFYNLTLPLQSGLFSKLFAWSIDVHTGNETCEKSQNSLAVFKHGDFELYRFPRNETLIARFSDWNASSANVELYLEPSCNYTVHVRLAPLETAGQIFRTYFRILPSFFSSIVLMSLFFQRKADDWSNFHRVLISNAYHLTIFPGFLVSILLAVLPNDWPHMLDGPEYFVILPIFCYIVAYAMVLLVATGAWYLIISFGNAVHAVFLRMVTTRFARFTNLRVPMPDQVADIALDFTFTKLPVIISVLLISMTLTTCGGFGLLAGLCFFVIKLFKMYEDILGDLWKAKIQDVTDGLSPLNFQFSCAMIWLLVTAINFPSLIHWVKSFSHDPSPQWDISMYLCLMTLPTIAVLWQSNVPKFNGSLWRLHRFVFYFMGLAVVIWGTFRLYISGFILCLVLITTAICHLISSIPLGNDEETNESVNAKDKSPSEAVESESVDSSEAEDSLVEEFPEIKTSYENAFKREKEDLLAGSSSSYESEDEENLPDLEKSENEDGDPNRSQRSRSKSRSLEKGIGASAGDSQNPSSVLDEKSEITTELNAQGDLNRSSSEEKENSQQTENSEINKIGDI